MRGQSATTDRTARAVRVLVTGRRLRQPIRVGSVGSADRLPAQLESRDRLSVTAARSSCRPRTVDPRFFNWCSQSPAQRSCRPVRERTRSSTRVSKFDACTAPASAARLERAAADRGLPRRPRRPHRPDHRRPPSTGWHCSRACWTRSAAWTARRRARASAGPGSSASRAQHRTAASPQRRAHDGLRSTSGGVLRYAVTVQHRRGSTRWRQRCRHPRQSTPSRRPARCDLVATCWPTLAGRHVWVVAPSAPDDVRRSLIVVGTIMRSISTPSARPAFARTCLSVAARPAITDHACAAPAHLARWSTSSRFARSCVCLSPRQLRRRQAVDELASERPCEARQRSARLDRPACGVQAVVDHGGGDW